MDDALLKFSSRYSEGIPSDLKSQKSLYTHPDDKDEQIIDESTSLLACIPKTVDSIIYGTFISNTDNVASADDCARICESNPSCVGYNYYSASYNVMPNLRKKCSLFSSINMVESGWPHAVAGRKCSGE